eukprot:TRINITY_DN576_c0_g1_i1.p1 TRINITY_DN576_c0_g1~~TRINITY_DN576_c0_g1_i1.p1  ORF type:complete len:1472 (+),score=555.35 TRINITY_DN576_c0_g1_i1:466-4416(+)
MAAGVTCAQQPNSTLVIEALCGTLHSTGSSGSSGTSGTSGSSGSSGTSGTSEVLSLDQPGPVEANVTGPNSVRVWWSLHGVNKRAAPSAAITGITLEMSNNSVNYHSIYVENSTNLDYTVTDLKPSSDYWFRIFTSNAYGRSPSSSPVTVRTEALRSDSNTGEAANQNGNNGAINANNDAGANLALIVGIAAGVLFCCIVIAVTLLIMRRRRKHRVAPESVTAASDVASNSTPPFVVTAALSEVSSEVSFGSDNSDRVMYEGHVTSSTGQCALVEAGDFKFGFTGRRVIFMKPQTAAKVDQGEHLKSARTSSVTTVAPQTAAKVDLGEHLMSALRINLDDSVRLTTETGFVDFTTPGGAHSVPELAELAAHRDVGARRIVVFPGDASSMVLIGGTGLTDKQIFDALLAMPADLRFNVLRTLMLESEFVESATGQYHHDFTAALSDAQSQSQLMSKSDAIMHLRHYLVLPTIQHREESASFGDATITELTDEPSLASADAGDVHLNLSLQSKLTEEQCDLAMETLVPPERTRVRRALRDPLAGSSSSSSDLATSSINREEFDNYGFLDDSDDEGTARTVSGPSASRLKPLSWTDAKDTLIDGFRTYAKLPDINKQQTRDAVRARRRHRALRPSAADMTNADKQVALEVLPIGENRAVKKAYRTHLAAQPKATAVFWPANDPEEEAIINVGVATQQLTSAPNHRRISSAPADAPPAVPLISIPAADRLLLKGWKSYQKLGAIDKAWVKDSVQDRVTDSKPDLTIKDLHDVQKVCALATVPEPTRSAAAVALSLPLTIPPERLTSSGTSTPTKLDTSRSESSAAIARSESTADVKSNKTSLGHKMAKFQAEVIVVNAFRSFAKLPLIKKKPVHDQVTSSQPEELDASYSAKVMPAALDDEPGSDIKKTHFREDWQKDADAFGPVSRSASMVRSTSGSKSSPESPRARPSTPATVENSIRLSDGASSSTAKTENLPQIVSRMARGLSTADVLADNQKFLKDLRKSGVLAEKLAEKPIPDDDAVDAPPADPAAVARKYNWKWDVDLTIKRAFGIGSASGADIAMTPDIAARIIQTAYRAHRVKLHAKRMIAVVTIQRWWRSKKAGQQARFKRLRRVTKMAAKTAKNADKKVTLKEKVQQAAAQSKRNANKSSKLHRQQSKEQLKVVKESITDARDRWLRRKTQVAKLRDDRLKSELEEIDITQQNMRATAAKLIQRAFRNKKQAAELARHKAANARLRSRKASKAPQDEVLEAELDAVLESAYGFSMKPTSGLSESLRNAKKRRAAKIEYVDKLKAVEVDVSPEESRLLDEAEDLCQRQLF